MPVLEFPNVHTLPGVSPKNERFLGIAADTVAKMEGIGISPCRFLPIAEDEPRAEQRVVSMMAVWPLIWRDCRRFGTIAFGPLTQFITLGEGVFMPVEKTPQDLQLMANESIATTIIRIKPKNTEKFEKQAKGRASWPLIPMALKLQDLA